MKNNMEIITKKTSYFDKFLNSVIYNDGLIISLILHLLFFIIILVSPYIQFSNSLKNVNQNETIIVDLQNLTDFEIGKKTIIPQTKVKPVKKDVKPPVTPVSQTKNAVKVENKVVIKKQEQPDYIENNKKTLPKNNVVKSENNKNTTKKDLIKTRMGGLDDLLASVDNLKKNKQTAKNEIKKGIEAAEINDNLKIYNAASNSFLKQIALSYIDAIKIKLASCWNIDTGAKGIKDMQIKIKATLSQEGNISSVEILNNVSTSSSFNAVAESAKRALIICSPYSLPKDMYEDWKSIIFTFYPNKKMIK